MLYEDLDVFKKSHHLVLDIYKITSQFPKEEKYRLTDQMIRSAYSVPSNIAEGNRRNTIKEYVNFLYTSRGSLHELQYFLLLSKDLGYIKEYLYKEILNKCEDIGKMLNRLINSLKKKNEKKV
jgi:four helix bundle protein